MKKFWFRKVLMFVTLFILAVIVFGTIVMGLWNAILPAVLGVKVITFWQALGILLLSKILFGGFKGGCRGRNEHSWKNKMREKWGAMTPEDKEKLRTEWKARCGRRWSMRHEDNAAAE